jgi:signal transduction histidine kinase
VKERTKEILAQKEEIESQKENIEEKNIILEKQYQEITLKNHQILTQNISIEEARKEIDEKNKKLSEYATTLEQNVKERTEQLRSTLVSLNETNKELDQFIYRSAHDLKGPLASITGLCYLGRMETTDPKMTDLLRRLEVTTEGMLDKLSRLMKIHEFNTLELALTVIDYESLLLEIINEVNAVYSCDDITITINVGKDKAHTSDRTLLKILLKNVIENAVKYKDSEKKDRYIRINVDWKKGTTIISIADNGIGIPLNQADRVFDLFVVATENIKGFGMGLYEAKLIARRLRGTIKLQYPESGDTEFVISL